MFFWRRVALQSPADDLKPTATPGYSRNFRELNKLISQGKSFSGREPNALFLNEQGKGFAEIGGLMGVDYQDDSRAVATVDWDHDGDLDLWVTNRSAPQVRLLKNNSPADSASLSVRLIGNGKATNRDAVGARLVLSPTDQIRTVRAGDGFLSQSSSWVHFGLGEAVGNFELSVDWPGGETEHFEGLKSGTRYLITQGNEKPAEVLFSKLPTPEVSNPQQPAKMPKSFWVANRVPFPKLQYTDATGTSRATTDLRGKPILINLWATWCPDCLQELKTFGELDAQILALNVDGLTEDAGENSQGMIAEILKQSGYDQLSGSATAEGLDKIEILMEHLTSRRDPLVIPASFLVDRDGQIAKIYFGPIDGGELNEDLNLLKSSLAVQLRKISPRAGRWFGDPRQIDRAAYLGDYVTAFAKGGFPEESMRLAEETKKGNLSAKDHYNLAKTAAQQRLVEKAIGHYREALRLDPNYGQALTGLGALFLVQKQVEEAENLFEKALALDPNHATALINLAMIDQSRGQKDRALERLQKVVERNPDYEAAQMNLGSLLASMKRFDEAVLHLSKASKLNPKRVATHLNLASIFMEKEEWVKAEERYRLVQQLNPKMPHADQGMGRLQARKNLHGEAVKSFQRAISLGLGSVNLYLQLARSQLALGDKGEASQTLQKVLAIDPESVEAKQLAAENDLIIE